MRQAGLYAVNARKYKPKAGEIRGDWDQKSTAWPGQQTHSH
jgi:hypothetical protein